MKLINLPDRLQALASINRPAESVFNNILGTLSLGISVYHFNVGFKYRLSLHSDVLC